MLYLLLSPPPFSPDRYWLLYCLQGFVHAKSLQSWPTLCDPMGCSPPGSSVHGILQAKNTGVGWHALLLVFPQFYPFPECHIFGIIQYVTFSDWHLNLSNMHLNLLHVFSRLDGTFLFSIEYILLLKCTPDYLSMCLLKDILVASKFWQLLIKLLKQLYAGFCVDVSFQLLWVNNK